MIWTQYQGVIIHVYRRKWKWFYNLIPDHKLRPYWMDFECTKPYSQEQEAFSAGTAAVDSQLTPDPQEEAPQ